VGTPDEARKAPWPRERGLTRGQAAIVAVAALVLTSIVGAAFSEPAVVSTPGCGPRGAPPFYFEVGLTGNFSTGSLHAYNVTLWDLGGSALRSGITAAWSQLYVFPGWTTPPRFVAILFGLRGTAIGLFNSSQSTWIGAGTTIDQPLPDFGGWILGASSPLVVGETLQVRSDSSLQGDVLEVGIELPAPWTGMEIDFVPF